MKRILCQIVMLFLAVNGFSQTIVFDLTKFPIIKDPILFKETDQDPVITLTNFNAKDAGAILEKSTISVIGKVTVNKTFKEIANAIANKNPGKDYKSLLQPVNGTDSSLLKIELALGTAFDRDNLKKDGTGKIVITIHNGKTGAAGSERVINISVPKEEIGPVAPAQVVAATSIQSCEPAYGFIKKEMFPEGKRFDLSNYQNEIDARRKRKLPGEYILLYDFKYGDYEMYKKKVVKNSEGEQDNFQEFYKKKNSRFFSPAVGSQFKVEVANYSDTARLNLELSYRDNFLEEETRFRTIFSAFNTNSDNVGKTTAPPDDEQAGEIKDVQKLKKFVDDLSRLRSDLCFYYRNFQYSSFTSDVHQQNVNHIISEIKAQFILEGYNVIPELKVKAGGNTLAAALVKEVEFYFNRVTGFQSIAFNSFRLKDRDNLILQLKDGRNRLKKEEELRLSSGFKIDFSSGIFFTGLKDANYVYKDTTVSYTRTAATVDTTGKMIIKENGSLNKINFGILMHGYPRLSSNYNIGITAGTSTNTNLDLNVLFGGSLMLGSTRRIVLSGGMIWGKANRLSNTVQEGFHRINADVSDAGGKPVFYPNASNIVPVVSDWYRSWFYGISFNFSRP